MNRIRRLSFIAYLFILLITSVSLAETTGRDEMMLSSDLNERSAIKVPAGNKDRGVRLTLKARNPAGSMDIALKIPGNGAQTEAQCTVKNTYANKWCDVALELPITTDDALEAFAKIDPGEVKDVKAFLIEAAANVHYGDHINVNYDRDLRLKPMINDGSCTAGIVYGDEVVAVGDPIGEFTATFESTSHEFVDTISNWKAGTDGYTVSDDGKTMTLTGKFHLNSICGEIEAVVKYEAINNHVIKKTITFNHKKGPEIFYSVDTFIASDKADGFFSWGNFDRTEDAWLANYEILQKGSEQIPAVGYRIGNITIGLISDTGAHNGWARMYRTWG